MHYGTTPQKLITHGLFSYSRNPIYVGLMLICLGTALLLGSLSTFIILVIEWFIFNFIMIPPEEKILEKTFGEAYSEYKRKVRRWL